MPRRTPIKNSASVPLEHRIDKCFEAECYAELRSLFHRWRSEYGAHPVLAKQIDAALHQYEELLPKSPKTRFYFDAWIIHDIVRAWDAGPIKLPATIIPTYGAEWKFGRFRTIGENPTYSVFTVIFPGDDAIDDVDLLSYPWVYHELGHAVVRKFGKSLRKALSNRVTNRATQLIRGAFADSAFTKDRVQKRITSLQNAWSAEVGAAAWSDELVVDLIALWATGPAFLAALQDALETHKPDPFRTDTEHPPYVIRLNAILTAATRLGWQTFVQELVAFKEVWRIRSEQRPDHNHLVDLGNVELVSSLVDTAFDFFRQWKLPLVTKSTLAQIEQNLAHKTQVQTALELLLSAWCVRAKSETAYYGWERSTLDDLSIRLLDGDAR